MQTYVCAFRGRRDSYQVPLALAEAGLLDQFITDAYALRWIKDLAPCMPDRLQARVASRLHPGIPDERVRCLWATTVLEHLRHQLGFPPTLTYLKLDSRFSEAAARRARKQRSHLFLYSPYAWEAFTGKYSHTCQRVLFQYHPHPELERRVLAEDTARYPGIGESFAGVMPQALPEDLIRRERDCWRHADVIICASQFTRRSLLEAGCEARRCCVVPYGIEVPDAMLDEPPAEPFHAVFAGSGGQRKGLHHLLLAWQRAGLASSSRLTLVCRVLDTGIQKMLGRTKGVELRRGVSALELQRLYATSSLFVMPSLVEGFGQVYLEALAQGCPVLGTASTALPDLGDEADGVYLVAPGDIDELTAALRNLAQLLPGNRLVRTAARRCAARRTWSAFRDGVRQALRN
jgi:glycosyltransferase involved in cell wall biosynthesis